MGIAYRSTLGEPPTGNAVVGDVLYGKTFSNADGTDKVGTMPNNGKVTPSALNPGGSYTIPAGYHNGQGVVSANSNTGTYTANTRGAALDMGAANLNRYVNTNGVPNSNTGTYTFPANDTGGTKDLGEANNYRYVNAQNVYNKGKADGASASFLGIGQYMTVHYGGTTSVASYSKTTTLAGYTGYGDFAMFECNGKSVNVSGSASIIDIYKIKNNSIAYATRITSGGSYSFNDASFVIFTFPTGDGGGVTTVTIQ